MVKNGIPLEHYSPQPIDIGLTRENMLDMALYLSETYNGEQFCYYPTNRNPTTYTNVGGNIIGAAGSICLFLRQYKLLNQAYEVATYVDRTTSDFIIYKFVGGSVTLLAAEAIDLTDLIEYDVKGEIVGSTISAIRDGVLKLQVVDTLYTSGYLGFATSAYGANHYLLVRDVKMYMPSTPEPTYNPKAFYLLPIIGSGTIQDPYRPKLPEEVVKHPRFGAVNINAVGHSSIIPSNPETGEPLHPGCLSLVASKTPAKIKTFEDMIEADLKVNDNYRNWARALVPEYGERLKVSVDEAKGTGRRIDPKLPENFADMMYVTETE